MPVVYSEEKWISWMDELAEKDVVIVDDFISDELYKKIMDFFSAVEENERLKKAGIGSSVDYQIQKEVRGDLIYWLDQERDILLAPLFSLIEELREKLGMYCFISLSGSEFHLAKYPTGSKYEKHIDQFNTQSNRQITVLIYLNKDWKNGDGGELKISNEEGGFLVEPIAKRMLLFKSDVVEHEVLLTSVPRYSLSGWLLRQPATLGGLLS
ncbi:MAG: 2OG-Fe(II) oxygenase [Balneola sp.]